MSRHRAVKNLDLADELDDGAFDGNDDYYEDMTSEQQAQMAHAFSQVQAVLGTDSPISDKQIRDALWDSYFDVDGSIAHLLDEQHKKEVRKQKEQGEALSLQSPPPPTQDLVENSGADADVHEGSAVIVQDETGALPPTAELASLSLRTPSSSSASADGDGGSPAPAPKNKLAAKMAANKAKRALAAPPAVGQPGGGGGAAGGAAPQLGAESPSQQQQQQPEKKLSKLQQKMLAAKAAKATAASAGAGSNPAPAPPRSYNESGAAGATSPSSSSAQPPPSSEEETPDALPMIIDGLPPRTSAAAVTSEHVLSAAPSAFASALAPAAAASSSAQAVVATVPALSTMLAPMTPVLFGPSPDDKVLEARKGTALAGAGAVAGAGAGSRTNGTGSGAGTRRPVGVAVPGAGRR